MATYVLRRIIQSIPILFGISILIFLIVQLAPGSPIDRFRNPRVSPEQLEAIMRLYGLDRPLFEQYVSWITAFVQVWRPDAWGYSFIDGQPVLGNVMARVPATMLLMGSAADRDHHRVDPGRDPGGDPPVQHDRQGHHHLRHDRLRDALIPAGHLHPVLRRRRALPVDRVRVPALRVPEPRERRQSPRHHLPPDPAGHQPGHRLHRRLLALSPREHA